MRSRHFPLALLCLFGTVSHAQFNAIVTSTPDSVLVRMNGIEQCYTPCIVPFFWRHAVDGKIAFDVSAPGFKTWSDTLDEKPYQLDHGMSVHLEREIPKLDLDSSQTVVAFDRLLADFKDDDPIGSYSDEEGHKEILRWEGMARIGTNTFGRRFEEILLQAGFRTPSSRVTKLFAGARDDRPVLPRFVVGAKIIEYRIEQHFSEGKHHGEGPYVGSTRLRIEWQVLDKTSGQLALTGITEGSARHRQWGKQPTGENLIAFEDALVKFLRQGPFVELVKNATGPSTISTAAAPTMPATEITLPRVELPDTKSLSELIKFAEQSCVTVITDGGHGSGAIISLEGHVLSAYHVVEGVNRIEVLFSNGLRQEARILAFDAANDVVLLDIAGSGFKPLPLGSSEHLSLGEELITIGTPAEVVLGQSVARGILSGKRKLDEGVFLQTDMSVSPGNSGGPLINPKGEIIGIVQRKVVGDAVEGIGLAIPVERAMEMLHLRVVTP